MEDRLEKLLVELENQKVRKEIRVEEPPLNTIMVPQQPYPMQQPMYYPYPPQPYYYPPPPQYPMDSRHKSSRRRDYSPEDSENDFKPRRSTKDPRRATQKSGRRGGNTRERIRTKLRIYLFVVAYTFFIRA